MPEVIGRPERRDWQLTLYLSPQRVADPLACPVNTVRSDLRRALGLSSDPQSHWGSLKRLLCWCVRISALTCLGLEENEQSIIPKSNIEPIRNEFLYLSVILYVNTQTLFHLSHSYISAFYL